MAAISSARRTCGSPVAGLLEQPLNGLRHGLPRDLLGQQADACTAADDGLSVHELIGAVGSSSCGSPSERALSMVPLPP